MSKKKFWAIIIVTVLAMVMVKWGIPAIQGWMAEQTSEQVSSLFDKFASPY